MVRAKKQSKQAVASTDVVVAYNSPRGIVFNLDGRKVLVNGNATHLCGAEMGIIPVGKYGYTIMPASDWEQIKAVYGKMSMFTRGLIFAESNMPSAEARADEQAELRHGLEPVDANSTETEPAEKG